MKNLNFTTIGISILIVFNIAILSIMFFHRPGRHRFHGMRPGQEIGCMKSPHHPANFNGNCEKGEHSHFPMAELNLSDEQKKQMEKLRMEHMKSVEESMGKVQDLRKKEMEMIGSGKLDQKQMNEMVSEYASYQKEIHLKKLQHFIAINTILTPEQREKLKKQHPFHDKMDHTDF